MTRKQGRVASAADLVPFGHLSCAFQDRADFLARAAGYIADGLEKHHFIAYVGEKSRDALRAELSDMPAIGERSSDIQVTSINDHYVFLPGDDVIDVERCVARYAEAAQQALANGYMGFRAVVDATAVARTAGQRAAMTGLGYHIGQAMAKQPFSALFAYNTSQLGSATAELTCLDPFVGDEASNFRLYAQPGFAFALTGQLDAANDAVFTTALHRTWALIRDNPIIDAQGLEFISPRQLCTLDQCARADDRTAVLRTNQPVPTRLASLLKLTNVRVEPHD